MNQATPSITQDALIEDSPMTGFLRRVAAYTLGGMFTDGYILGHIGIALSMAAPLLGLDGLWVGLLAASTLLGILVGSPVAGWLADRCGRRRLLAWNFALICLVALSHLLVDDAGMLLLVRTTMGVAIGAEYAIGAATLSEFSPHRNRGPLLASLNCAWIVGFVSGFVFASAMRSAGITWQVIFASAAIPALVVLILRVGMPESPRWLIAQGRHTEALNVVRKFYGRSYGIRGLGSDTKAEGNQGIGALLSPRFRTRTLFAGGFWAFQVMPLFALTIFLPQVFSSLGIKSEFKAELMVNGMLLAGAVIGIVAIRSFPRRTFVISTFAIVTIALLFMAASEVLPNWVGIFSFAIFVLVASAASNLEYVYPSEIFPTEVRATGMGVAAAISRVGAIISTFLLPIALDRIGSGPTMVVLASVAGLGVLISVLWAPETKGKSLIDAAHTGDK